MKKFISILVLSILPLCNVQSQSFTTNNRAQELQSQIASKRGLNIDNEVNELLTLYQQHYSAGSLQYADALMWVAMACAEAGDNRQGLKLLEQSDARFSQYGKGVFNGRDTIQEIFHLDLKSKLLYNSGADYRALMQAKKSLQLKKEYFGEHSEVYLNALLDVSRLYAERLKYKKSNSYHNLGYKAYVELIRKEFCSTSESERTAYWEKAIKYINKTLELGHKSGSKSQRGGEMSLASAAYDAVLLSKGLLLNATIGFENYIINSGNKEAIRNLQLKKILVEQQADQGIIDSLDYVILGALQEKGQQFQLPHLSISWKDVAKKLSSKDLAVEFYKTASGDYGALLLKKGWKSPKVVRLKNFVSVKEKYEPISMAVHSVSLEKYSPDQSRALWNLSKAIWTDDIVKYFPDDDEEGRIYFAADADFLITGIEYLPFIEPNADGSFVCLSDLFDINRLSSTRELVQHSTNESNTEIAIYGGLLYDMNMDDMIADAQQHHQRIHTDLAFSGETQRAVRAADRGIPYLKGTQREADTIMTVVTKLKDKRLTPKLYMGDKGTETSFKTFSGKGERVIHVATHGFFYNETDTTFNRFGLGDNSLVRSGLFFAGADNKWLGDDIPTGVDDGFLTSLEISNLDFRGLDLVVLSACETGKGNVKGDGVFGLQRGFKMASANSILMSLWKVDDDATCVLMTEFYKHWMGGATKHHALEMARQTVRSHKEKGWDAPKYWAAFILLDGIN